MTKRKSKGSSGSDPEKRILGKRMTFGAAVEGLRVGEQISQAALARKLYVSRQYLRDVEKARRLVSLEQAAKFARAFGHPPNVLVRLALQDAASDCALNSWEALARRKTAGLS